MSDFAKKEISFDGRLVFDCPEGFRIMREEELPSFLVPQGTAALGIQKDQSGLTFAVSGRRINPVLAALLDPRNTIRGLQLRLHRALKDQGYTFLEYTERVIAHQRAKGFRFTVRIRDREGEGSVWMIRHRMQVYTLYTYAFLPLPREEERILEELQASVRL
ncbi:MAG: hypothetical protein J6H18_01540 [Lachnospiraceae bacterium]|nr:hypothetical protein [Lachnospiraceae bacterium]